MSHKAAREIARQNSKAWALNNKLCKATRNKHKRYGSKAARAADKREPDGPAV